MCTTEIADQVELKRQVIAHALQEREEQIAEEIIDAVTHPNVLDQMSAIARLVYCGAEVADSANHRDEGEYKHGRRAAERAVWLWLSQIEESIDMGKPGGVLATLIVRKALHFNKAMAIAETVCQHDLPAPEEVAF